MDFDYGQNGAFVGQKGQKTGWARDAKSGDEFDARQRLRLTLEAVASENLSGTIQFEIGTQRWGKGDQGGALGADGNNVVKVKHSYIDWIVPQTDLKVRMGLQPLALPSFAAGSQILDTDVAGVSLNYQFTENAGLTFFWARPYNDNGAYGSRTYQGYPGTGKGINQYLDNVDMFALAVPLTFDGVKVTPFAMLGFMGPGSLDKNWKRTADYNALMSGKTDPDDLFPQTSTGSEYDLYRAGMYPAGGSVKGKWVNSYGTAFWAGLALDVTAFDPLHFALDFNYGSVSWQDDSSLRRAGWMLNGLVEYKMDWATPGIVAWYASGDDSNRKNGSERMPYVSNNSLDNNFSNFAFSGGPTIARESVIATNMVGTWGVGLRLKDMSFIEDLKHTFRVNYIGGTNSPKMVKRGNFQSGPDLGYEGLYMSTVDHGVEIALQNQYKIYDNLKVLFDVSYLATHLDYNRMGKKSDGKRADISDPWNINLQFQYAF